MTEESVPPMALVWMRQIQEKGWVNTTDGGMADMWLSPMCSIPRDEPYVACRANPNKDSQYYNHYILTEAGVAYMKGLDHG